MMEQLWTMMGQRWKINDCLHLGSRSTVDNYGFYYHYSTNVRPKSISIGP